MGKRVKLALAWMPQSTEVSLELARAAERLGYVQFGVGDGPFLHHETYVTTTACLLGTTRIAGGPFVTNNVARNWTVHASAARTFGELTPGRFSIGLAVGDGAVRSVGMKPMKWSDLAETTKLIRQRAPDDLRVHVTVSGPRGAEIAGTFADVLVIMLGDAPRALNELTERARAARARAGVTRPLEIWTFHPFVVVSTIEEAARVKAMKRAHSYSVAHFAFQQTYESKDVPAEWRADIDERLARYDYDHHAMFTGDNPNHLLFADRPEIEEYLVDRMFWIGTEDEVREKFSKLADATDLDGMWCHAQSIAEAETFVRVLGPVLDR